MEPYFLNISRIFSYIEFNITSTGITPDRETLRVFETLMA